MINNNEIWEPVKEFEDAYKVSNLGRVESIQRNGTIGGILKGRVGKFGYEYVILQYKGFKKTVKTHRLVAQAFMPNPENKPQVNHINGIKTDNRVENLEWCTSAENIAHSFSIGLSKAKQRDENHMTKVNSKAVIEILNLYAIHDIPQSIICELYGISQSNVSIIAKQFIANVLKESDLLVDAGILSTKLIDNNHAIDKATL